MKLFIIIAPILLVLASCNSTNLKIGDCIQKPDEMTVWKITNKDDDNKASLIQTGIDQKVEKQTTLSSSWIITSCL